MLLLQIRVTLKLLIDGLVINRCLLLQRDLSGYEDRLLKVAWLEELDRFFAFLSLVVEEVDGRLARELHIPAAALFAAAASGQHDEAFVHAVEEI